MHQIDQVSLVIPMYKEEENVRPLVEESARALSSFSDFEIVVVDDCSSDNTFDRLVEMQAEIPQLRVLRHEKNAGQSVAVINGVKAAKFDWIATIDGDGQNDPADIPNLAKVASESVEPKLLIAGHRANRKDTWSKKISSRLANKIRGGLLHDDCPDSGCGLKLFQRDVFLAVPHFKNLHRFMPAIFRRQGAQIHNVVVNHRERTLGQSKYGFMNRAFVGLVDMFGVMWLVRRPSVMEAKESNK